VIRVPSFCPTWAETGSKRGCGKSSKTSIAVTSLRLERAELTANYWPLEKEAKKAGLCAIQLPDVKTPGAMDRVLEVGKVADSPAQLGQGKRKGRGGGNEHLRRGDSQIARDLGITRQGLQRANKIAALPDTAKEKARELGLGRNQEALLKAAKETEPDRMVARGSRRGRLGERRPPWNVGARGGVSHRGAAADCGGGEGG
jgi:hypothetical protein